MNQPEQEDQVEAEPDVVMLIDGLHERATIPFMKPLQVYLADDDMARLKAWARDRNATASDVVREAVRAIVRSHDPDPFFAAAGMLDGLGDASVHHDRLVVEAEESARVQQASPKSKNARAKGGTAQRGGARPVRRHRGVARLPRSR